MKDTFLQLKKSNKNEKIIFFILHFIIKPIDNLLWALMDRGRLFSYAVNRSPLFHQTYSNDNIQIYPILTCGTQVVKRALLPLSP